MPAHIVGWLGAFVLAFVQPFGKVAADTKHDLVANPHDFLSGALHAWTDTFPLGQMQNQAYGYVFPQGLFFLLADPLPDWVAQRLWWALLMGIGFSGFLLLLRRAQVGTEFSRILAAVLFVLSPRTLTTLGAISSEAWPIMLAPWTLWPLLATHSSRRPQIPTWAIASSVLAVSCMGAVNATATMAACVPAGAYLLYRRAWRALGLWLLGCALVSAWWIVPLLVLGQYASPFTDYIESATVTTSWLGLAEILRGTTSWAPFVETERIAGNLVVSNPYFVVITLGISAIGLIGLAKAPRYWLYLLALGIAILGGAHLAISFLDGPGVALRNVHKFDLLVRMPLMVGVAVALSTLHIRRTTPRQASLAVLALLLVASATSPAWSGRLLPRGAYDEVPSYWHEATDYINEHAKNTRTLIWPPAQFARQDWGWTRDEPAQPLLSVPWVVRDAVPLVNPEAIRSLDGLRYRFSQENLARMGVGAVIVRHDLDTTDRTTASLLPGMDATSFGEVDVVLIDPDRTMGITSAAKVPRVAGGGEVLNMLGDGTYRLVDGGAQIVTDTPMLTGRNYGELGSVSAPLASSEEATDVTNPVKDYPSVGPLTKVTGVGEVTASSSAADSSSFGGANPAASVTAAVDGDADTAWYPTPGPQSGQWLELRPTNTAAINVVKIQTTGDDVEITFSSGDAKVTEYVEAGQTHTIRVPGPADKPVRITLGASRTPVGIAEVSLSDRPVTRVVTVPDTSPEVQQFIFQRVFVDTGTIIRSFTAPRDMTVRVEPSTCYPRVFIDGVEYTCGDEVKLTAGEHELRSDVTWVKLTALGFDPSGASTQTLTRTGDAGVSAQVDVGASDEDRILVTTRAFNSGLRGWLSTAEGDLALESTTINAGSQGFVIPAGKEGQFRMEFAGDRAYRLGLFAGGTLAIMTVLGLATFVVRRRSPCVWDQMGPRGANLGVFAAVVGALSLAVGPFGFLAGAVAWAIIRFTLIPRRMLITVLMLIAAMWLGRAAWPSENYAGNTLMLQLVCALAVATMSNPKPKGTKN